MKNLKLLKRRADLGSLPAGKLLINTINAHSYNIAQKDALHAEALIKGDVLLPDGVSIVMAIKLLRREKINRITGWDLFMFEMKKLDRVGGTCFFLGSSENVLEIIKTKAAKDFKNIKVVTYSPPYKEEFTKEDSAAMIDAINAAKPDLLWIGMTAPKQEKWVYTHIDQLNINCHIGTIGAVFDFYAGTVKRAPIGWQKYGLEWLFRLLMEPRRMWRRYLIGNTLFIYYILKEKLTFSAPPNPISVYQLIFAKQYKLTA